MTLEEIRRSDKPFLTPGDIAPVLGSDPQTIRVTARVAPEQLGFPVARVGNRTKIPRVAFLAFLGVKEGEA